MRALNSLTYVVSLFSSLAVTLLSFGCGSNKLAKADVIDNLRILDIITATPEVDAGDSVTVTPYVSDPKGAGRSLTVVRETCVDLGVNLGADPTCVGNSTRTILTTTTETPGSSSNLYTGALADSTFNVPAASVIFTDPVTGIARSAIAQYNGISYLFFLTVTASDGETRTAFKRIVVSTKTTKNQNPSLTVIQFGSVADTDASVSQPTVATYLSVTTPTGQEESYTAVTTNGTLVTRSEVLSVFWFATAGDFHSAVTDYADTNLYTPPSTSETIVTYVGLLKDNRGGSSIRIISK